MTTAEILKSGEDKMHKSIDKTKKDLANVRTGRANPLILDKITVDYYGTPTPLRNLSNVSVQDGQTLVIQPYDRSALINIEKAIQKSDLGLTPNNDGTAIRMTFPPLTEDRRKEIAKTVKKTGEEAKVAIRNIRRDITDAIKKAEKEDSLSEDEVKKAQDQAQKLTDKFIKDIDVLIAEKEKEVMTV